MKMINKSLEDPVVRVSNETIGGLCHLVITEVGVVLLPSPIFHLPEIRSLSLMC